MRYAYNEKGERINNGRNNNAQSGMNQNPWRKRKLQIFENIRSGYKTKKKKKKENESKSKKNESKSKKRVSQKNKKLSRDQTLLQKSNQKN